MMRTILAPLAALLLSCSSSPPAPDPSPDSGPEPVDAEPPDGCALPNPGIGLCVHPAESCPPDDECWTWSCDSSGHCVASPRDAVP